MGERAKLLEAQCHSDWTGVYAADVWGEGRVSYLGRSAGLPYRLASQQCGAMGRQESAEAIVIPSHVDEGPNTESRTGHGTFDARARRR
jgi:hypothetical protein